jgi:hypothetical protein
VEKEGEQIAAQPEPQAKIEGFEGFEKVYTDIKSPGCVWRHELVKQTVDDYVEVYEIATDFAQLGCTVKMLPILNDPNDPLRAVIFKGAKENKCPDLDIDGEFIDVKTPLGDPTKNSLNNNVKKAYKQANYVIIRISAQVPYWLMKFVADRRFEIHESLHTIQFKIIGEKYYTFQRGK